MAIVDLTEIKKRVDAGLITERKHPQADLWIYNYTPKCQYDRLWDEYTLMCRGLILDANGTIVARPFPKFFNVEEHKAKIPAEPFSIAEKMDGSLGIMYWDSSANNYGIATRGSFSSDQAIKGTQMLRKYLLENGPAWIDDNCTYLFEIIYPSNRIVVDYGSAERLVLLAVVDTKTGTEEPAYFEQVYYADKVKMHATLSLQTATLDAIRKITGNTDNREGFVLHFASGLRLKFKFDEYVRLHRLLTQVSSKTIWELLKNDQPIEPILDNIPDEFFKWVQNTTDKLRQQHNGLMVRAYQAYERVRSMPTRKDMAAAIDNEESSIRAMTFALLDNRDDQANTIAWKYIKPKFEQPFRVDIDG